MKPTLFAGILWAFIVTAMPSVGVHAANIINAKDVAKNVAKDVGTVTLWAFSFLVIVSQRWLIASRGVLNASPFAANVSQVAVSVATNVSLKSR